MCCEVWDLPQYDTAASKRSRRCAAANGCGSACAERSRRAASPRPQHLPSLTNSHEIHSSGYRSLIRDPSLRYQFRLILRRRTRRPVARFNVRPPPPLDVRVLSLRISFAVLSLLFFTCDVAVWAPGVHSILVIDAICALGVRNRVVPSGVSTNPRMHSLNFVASGNTFVSFFVLVSR